MEPTGGLNDLLYLFSGAYIVFFILGFVAMVLLFFLSFFVFWIWNQTKRANNKLQKLIELFQAYDDRLKLEEKDLS